MDIIEQRYLIMTTSEKVWDALTNPKTIDKWGGGPATMDDQVGTGFSLWDGDVYGKNLEVVVQKKLVQEWYGGEWEIPSIVTFILNSRKGTTEVLLIHKDVPKEEMDSISEGWRDYYMEPIKKLLETSLK